MMNAPILIVDDEPDMCWAISHIIQSQGMNVITAYSGEDACTKLMAGNFSFVFLDAKLPDMDGLEVARRASTLLERRPRVVLVSGYHYYDDPVIRHAIVEGIICGFLAKPFTNKELLKTLQTLSQSSE
ncbi:response regulator [Pectobacteriaceae bacterium CE90]|nr:response regulator [Prodigiosinella sp. LS101]WJV54116.1 response regulator [Prodigiosinella sp. LS101]WJV58479.1 response regulator [Pectobacteriaceae bacterium C111]WJY14871.1 response regulator [Pectobacteriaceae bacterium CE90]